MYTKITTMTTTTTALHPFNGLFSRTAWVSRYQKGKTSLDLNEARDGEVLGYSGISWTICKQSAPRSRQITTPIPHLSILYRPDALSDAQPTVSRHRRHTVYKKTGHETSSLNSKYTVRQKKRNHFSFMNILLCNVI